MKADVTTLDAKKAGTIDLAEHIFGLEPRKDILHRAVTWQLAKRRAGTHKVKNRSEIARTGAKVYRQKGTGGARHGSKRVGQFRGGGRAFGPLPRDHSIGLPKKVRALALRHALSAKARSNALIVLDEASLPEPRTATLARALGALDLRSALFIAGETIEANFEKAARNIAGIDVLPVQGINVYDVLRCDKLVLTRAAIEKLEGRFNA